MSKTPSTEYTLALIRCISRRTQHIVEEFNAVGVALNGGLIDAKKAREMIEEIAPGCIDAVALSVLDGADSVRPDRSF